MAKALAPVLLCASVASAQVFVYPRVPDKSHVRYHELKWRHADILVGPAAQGVMDESPHDSPSLPGAGRPASPTRSMGWTGDGRWLVRGGWRAMPLRSGRVEWPFAEEVSPPPRGPTERPEPPFDERADGGVAQVAAADAGAPDGGLTGNVVDAGVRFAQSLDEKSGGVRLYFYDREQAIAERAAASIIDTYRELVERFRYVPTRTFPYILYSSYQEFLQTNLFPLQEGVLGVTSPQDLKLTLPYLGDHRMFREVSSHEMAHQFTIQKVRTLSEHPDVSGDPLMRLPLWFIEGLAEFYAQGGLQPEAEMLTRDILINPDVLNGYAMLDFFEDRPYSVLWTYKAGNVRCAFLEEVYGEGFLQKVLDASTKLVSRQNAHDELRPREFSDLLEDLTGDSRRVIAAKFEAWLKRRAYETYLDSEQDTAELTPLRDATEPAHGIIQSLAASPDGEVLLLRSLDLDTGDSRLSLVHRKAPDRLERVAVDGQPGIESLHPISPRNFALSADRLAFIAESNGRDVLYVQTYETKVQKLTGSAEPFRVRIALKERSAIPLGEHGLVAAYSPSFSPDGKTIAFIGLTEDGVRDIYVAELDGLTQLYKLTDDEHSERQLSWGTTGIVFTSDATTHGRYNLFRTDRGRPIERLTSDERDVIDPVHLPDGRILFTAYEDARAELFEVAQGEIVRRTSVPTGLFDAAPGPKGGLWALYHRSGQRRPVQIHAGDLLDGPRYAQEDGGPPPTRARLSLASAHRYDPLSVRNWEIGPVFGIVGGGTGGIYGQLFALSRDRLGNHAALLTLAMYGSIDLTDGYLLYINQERRLTWGGGPFQFLRFRLDRTFPDLPFQFFSGERFYGALGSVRWPFNRFVYVQADVALGGASNFVLPLEQAILSDGELNLTGEDLYPRWLAANAGARPQGELTLRFGHDTLRYHPLTGPLAGGSLLLEGVFGVQPTVGDGYSTLRLDAGRYFPIFGRSNFFVRGGAGMAFGGRLAREFFLSSFDTLRGVRFGDSSRLLGRTFFFSTAELQFPLNELIRVVLLSDLEAVVGVDFGGVGQSWPDVWDRRVLDGVFGFNFGLGPLVFRLHFAKNVGIGAPAGLPVPPQEWVTNFSIGIAGLGGLLVGP